MADEKQNLCNTFAERSLAHQTGVYGCEVLCNMHLQDLLMGKAVPRASVPSEKRNAESEPEFMFMSEKESEASDVL